MKLYMNNNTKPNMHDAIQHKDSHIPHHRFDCICALTTSPISVRYDMSTTTMPTSLTEHGDLHAARIVEDGVCVNGSDTPKYTKTINSNPASIPRYSGNSSMHVHLPSCQTYWLIGTASVSEWVLVETKTKRFVRGSHSELFSYHGVNCNSRRVMIGSNKNGE